MVDSKTYAIDVAVEFMRKLTPDLRIDVFQLENRVYIACPSGFAEVTLGLWAKNSVHERNDRAGAVDCFDGKKPSERELPYLAALTPSQSGDIRPSIDKLARITTDLRKLPQDNKVRIVDYKSERRGGRYKSWDAHEIGAACTLSTKGFFKAMRDKETHVVNEGNALLSALLSMVIDLYPDFSMIPDVHIITPQIMVSLPRRLYHPPSEWTTSTRFDINLNSHPVIEESERSPFEIAVYQNAASSRGTGNALKTNIERNLGRLADQYNTIREALDYATRYVNQWNKRHDDVFADRIDARERTLN